MNLTEYQKASSHISNEVQLLTKGSYISNLIPSKITESLELLVAFIIEAQSSIFKDGKVLKLSLFNIFSWWSFLKVTYKFISKLVEIWK